MEANIWVPWIKEIPWINPLNLPWIKILDSMNFRGIPWIIQWIYRPLNLKSIESGKSIEWFKGFPSILIQWTLDNPLNRFMEDSRDSYLNSNAVLEHVEGAVIRGVTKNIPPPCFENPTIQGGGIFLRPSKYLKFFGPAGQKSQILKYKGYFWRGILLVTHLIVLS